jgi:hypothetical protein
MKAVLPVLMIVICFVSMIALAAVLNARVKSRLHGKYPLGVIGRSVDVFPGDRRYYDERDIPLLEDTRRKFFIGALVLGLILLVGLGYA